jgi:SAM-dependent methyltransferase
MATDGAADVTDERYERERAFHDDKYTEGELPETAKFYTILERSRQRYIDAVAEGGTKGREVLEYGCGTGAHAYELAANGMNVTGIDISPVAVEVSKKIAADRGLDMTLLTMNAEKLEFDDNSFDLICGTSILHHLELDAACEEIARCLRPGGRAVFAEPLGYHPVVNIYRRRTPELRTPDEHPFKREDFAIIKRHFASVQVDYFGFTSLGAYFFRKRPSYQRVLNLLDGVDRGLFKVLPFTGQLAWFSVIVFENPRTA